MSFAPEEGSFSRRDTKPNRVRPGEYLWPELRVGRMATVCTANEQLDAFLKDSGRQNRRRGNTRVLTEVGCTYVRDSEMMPMILQRYPRIDGDVRRATDVYRGITKGVRQFIRESDRAVREQERLTMDVERIGITTDVTGPELGTQLWQSGLFAVTGQHGYGRNSLGFDLSENPELAAERQAVIDYLRTDEGLNVSRVDPNWEPHAVFFGVRPELRLAAFAMRYTEETPQLIALGPPAANTDL